VQASGWLQIAVTKTDVMLRDYLSSSSVVSGAFSALCMYSKFRHHHYPLLRAKFCFFRWTSPRRKIAYSITHSPSLFDAPGTKACASEKW